MDSGRKWLKSDRWDEWRTHETDQKKGVPPPGPQKPCPAELVLHDLVPPEAFTIACLPLIKVLERRRSRRKYTEEPLSLEELSFLLWATQGLDRKATQAVQDWLSGRGHAAAARATAPLRTVPSAGARHPFETYILVQRVSDLAPGLYRYLPLQHKLLVLGTDSAVLDQAAEAFMRWVRHSAAIFLWTVIPYRSEWRYTFVAHKMIAQESGHICQNLYLAAESIGVGACAIGAYDQAQMDALLGVDGEDEFTIYVAPVGKVTPVGYHFEH